MFSLAMRTTYRNSRNYIHDYKRVVGNIPAVLVGSKADLVNDRKVNNANIHQKRNMHYIESSNHWNYNIHEIFLYLSRDIYCNQKLRFVKTPRISGVEYPIDKGMFNIMKSKQADHIIESDPFEDFSSESSIVNVKYGYNNTLFSEADTYASLQRDPRLYNAIYPVLTGGTCPIETGSKLIKPTWFFVEGLSGSPFREQQYQDKINELMSHQSTIIEEYITLTSNAEDIHWTEILAENNFGWSSYWLINQGVVVNEKQFPQTRSILEKVLGDKMILGSCIGYTYFSKIQPGTKITPHCGPCNLKIRIQIPISTSPGCTLTVGNETHEYRQDKIFVLDDTYIHSVSNDSGEERVVLLVDVWNPQLTQHQIDILLDLNL
eukprot:TRINITY_DN1381_c0_g1_i1.p1 TRINITY_DN1381_c0_g1~~TRINITY_DN1381_c0_g1_i1.p1  ORF type:complete len:377 (+),score=67.18 TRINITY_DN1381_c0_g1_i1:556-1686(+)